MGGRLNCSHIFVVNIYIAQEMPVGLGLESTIK